MGLMPFSSDGVPIVGECAELGYGGLWLACGFGPSGIMEGPHAATLLAERLLARLRGQPEQLADDARTALRVMDPCRPSCCVREMEGELTSPGEPQLYKCVLESLP